MYRHAFFVFVMVGITSSLFAQSDTLVIAFGSCNKTDADQSYWDLVAVHHPDIWLWLGDNIYADTNDARVMDSLYQVQYNNPYYHSFIRQIQVDGTWDDHDYGLNDGGKEWTFKDSSKQLFTHFMRLDDREDLRSHPGVYHATDLQVDGEIVRILALDTRSFRDTLTPSPDPSKRYIPRPDGNMLGEAQWTWLQEQLADTTVSMFILLSSVQVIATEQGYEKWENLQASRTRLLDMIRTSSPEGIVILSGDRHIAEYSVIGGGLDYPLLDITSSGLTHTWGQIQEEANQFRMGPLMIEKNFGILQLYRDDSGLGMRSTIYSAVDGRILMTYICPF
ncbi:MAG: alkaline phosphatase family protein [Chitinophagales bacterium]|nr:alkaline phosphatase family protein [Chitinophagales bacterium]MCB9021570.1 alkaline phosphatase family protein [Chitinophagales bacterium]HPE96972.1 alkaline phosphatase D family protein [Chitinophagales bacterium]HQU76458.1 alkaline phosphatase D family protein [Chitinophagales bacterium]HRX23110.1 alkaline phosphatase D family protein [Chitinophagales bacterium]